MITLQSGKQTLNPKQTNSTRLEFKIIRSADSFNAFKHVKSISNSVIYDAPLLD